MEIDLNEPDLAGDLTRASVVLIAKEPPNTIHDSRRYTFEEGEDEVKATAAAWKIFEAGRTESWHLNMTSIALEQSPERLHGITLKDYQLEGVGFMCKALEDRGGCILADMMGLGKTIEVVAVSVVRPLNAPTLIICPSVMAPVWKKEYERVKNPEMRTLVLTHKVNPQASIETLTTFDVVIITYKYLVNRWQDTIKVRNDRIEWKRAAAENDSLPFGEPAQNAWSTIFTMHWGRIILDEAHAICDITRKTNAAACALSAEERIACTGTPLCNDYSDIGSLLNFLQISPWGDPYLFLRSFMSKSGGARSKKLNNQRHGLLAMTLRSVMLRRLQTDRFGDKAIWDVPEPILHQVDIPMSDAEIRSQRPTKKVWEYPQFTSQVRGGSGLPPEEVMKMITEARAQMLHAQCGQIEGEDDDTEGKASQDRYEMIRKATEDTWNQSSRIRRAVDIIIDRLPNGKVLVFAEFRQGLVILSNGLKRHNIPFAHFNSSTSDDERIAIIDRFQNDDGTNDPKVLLITSKCGGAGITLTKAKTVILLHPPWTDVTDAQCIGRAVRHGQTDPVKVFILHSSQSIEHLCRYRQQEKKEKSESTLEIRNVPESVAHQLENIDQSEFDSLIGLLSSNSKRSTQKALLLAKKLGHQRKVKARLERMKQVSQDKKPGEGSNRGKDLDQPVVGEDDEQSDKSSEELSSDEDVAG